MGYRIEYGPQRLVKPKGDRHGFRRRILTAAFLLLGCILVRTFWNDGSELLETVLLPGEPTVTEQAFSLLLNDLRTGVPVGESVTAFCRFIVENGTDLLH